MSIVKGKVALITGAANGIGLEYSKALIRNGIKGVMIVDKDEKKASEAVCTLLDEGYAKIHFIKTDVSVESQLKNAFEAAIKEFKQLDIVINNAAGELKECGWTRLININFLSVVKGSYLAMKEYIPKYRSGPEGIIVNTASALGIQPIQSLPILSTSKHAELNFGRAIGTDYYLKKYHTRVLTICPGCTKTAMLKKDHYEGVDMDLLEEDLASYPRQTPDQCGLCLLKAIENGGNGSVWVVEGGEIYQYPFENRIEVGQNVKKDAEKSKKQEK